MDEADFLKINEYAKNLERDRNFVLNEAVRAYIAAERKAAQLERQTVPRTTPSKKFLNLEQHREERRREQELDIRDG
jgi:hypothetical protein